MSPAVVPTATYRLQFNAAFTFDDATGVVDYLDRARNFALLCVELLQGGPGKHARVRRCRSDPAESGDRRSTTATTAWVGTLRAHGMGHIIDLVPNHMGIAQSSNPWWQDVLENGPSSRVRGVLRHRLASAEARSSRTRSCCRFWATPTARCSNGRKSRCEYERWRLPRALLRHRAADRAGNV